MQEDDNPAVMRPLLPLAMVEVVPLQLLPIGEEITGKGNDFETNGPNSPFLRGPTPPLSAPMIKLQLRQMTTEYLAIASRSKLTTPSLKIILDPKTEDEEHNEVESSQQLGSANSKHVRCFPASREIIGGDVIRANKNWAASWVSKDASVGSAQGKIPIVRLFSDDPTDWTNGVPCWIRGYASVISFVPEDESSEALLSKSMTDVDREITSETLAASGKRRPHRFANCAVVSGTMVRILPTIPAYVRNVEGRALIPEVATHSANAQTIKYEGVPSHTTHLSLFTELSGEIDTYQQCLIHPKTIDRHLTIEKNDEKLCAKKSDFVLSCHDEETVRGLLVRMRALLDQPVLIGTTEDAFTVCEGKKAKVYSRRRAIERLLSHKGVKADGLVEGTGGTMLESENQKKKKETSANAFGGLLQDGALTVHDPFRCSGKTVLVKTLARKVLKCSAVHTIDASTLFARHGARGADAALESLLHSVVLSAAVGGGKIVPGRRIPSNLPDESICIILDHLDTFVPPIMSGYGRSAGDPSLPALNSMVAYLTKLNKSLRELGRFPYPTKNPMYNLNGANGFVVPVRVCLVGVVSCDDDGGRKLLNSPGGSYTVLDVLGGNRYRLPQPSAKTRFEAFRRAFAEANIPLSKKALRELPVIAASVSNARGIAFPKVTGRLRDIVARRSGSSGEATVEDVRAAVATLTSDKSRGSALGVTFLSQTGCAASGVEGHTTGGDLFASVGGNTDAKIALEDALALDPRQRQMLSAFGLSPPIGVLLYGPPGTGKTLLARATVQALKSKSVIGGAFISIRASDIVRSEVGKSEKLVVSSFEMARANEPAVIFIDEFQALFTERGGTGSGRLASSLLQCMDDLSRWRDADSTVHRTGPDHNSESRRIVVLGATNVPWMVDKAFLRPGRFDRVVYVGLPNLEERESILKVYVSNMHINESEGSSNKDDLCRKMATETEGFSGADLSALCRMAAVRCVHEDIDVEQGVGEKHFDHAVKHDVKRSSDDDLLEQLSSWRPQR